MSTLSAAQAQVLDLLVQAGDRGLPVTFSTSATTVSVVHASALEAAGLAHLATTPQGRKAWVTQTGIDHTTTPADEATPQEDAMHVPARPDLTATQEDLLRRMVGHARYADGARLGRTTDPNLREVNGRAARKVVEHGLLAIEDRDGEEWVVVTDDGRAWVHFTKGVAAGTEQLRADADRALATAEVASDEVPDLEDQDSGDQEAPDDEVGAADAGEGAAAPTDITETHDVPTVPPPSGQAAPSEPPPEGAATPNTCLDCGDPVGEEVGAACLSCAVDEFAPPPDTSWPDELEEVADHHEGRLITLWESKVLAPTKDAVSGRIPARTHGRRVVMVVVAHVDQVAYDVTGDDVARLQKLRPTRVWPLPDAYGERLAVEAARLVGVDESQQPLPFTDDLEPARDADELIERLNREELEARDDKGIRSWDDDGGAPATTVEDDRLDAVRDILQDAAGKGHPTRSMDHAALVALAKAGHVRIDPTPGRLDHENSWAFWTGPTDDAAMDALEASEADRPQVLIDRVDGSWRAYWPDTWTEHGQPPTTEPTIAQLQGEVRWWLESEGHLAPDASLDWTATAQGAWVADLPPMGGATG